MYWGQGMVSNPLGQEDLPSGTPSIRFTHVAATLPIQGASQLIWEQETGYTASKTLSAPQPVLTKPRTFLSPRAGRLCGDQTLFPVQCVSASGLSRKLQPLLTAAYELLSICTSPVML